MASKPIKLKIGDRVGFSGEFLRNTGQFTGAAGQMRGAIVDMIPVAQRALCVIAWDNGQEGKALDSNLARVGSAAMSVN